MRNLYAISDCHGQYEKVVKLLKERKVIDQDSNWAANDSIFINCGDTLDRGPKALELIRLWMKLETQAKETGGEFIHLMGNHEAFVYVVYSMKKQGRNEPGYEDHFKKCGGNIETVMQLLDLPEEAWWIRQRPAICKVGNYLFQHNDSFSYFNHIKENNVRNRIMKLNGTTCQMTTTLRSCNDLFQALSLSKWDSKEEDLPDYLESFECKKVIHGHSPRPGTSPYRYKETINIDQGFPIGENYGSLLELKGNFDKVII